MENPKIVISPCPYCGRVPTFIDLEKGNWTVEAPECRSGLGNFPTIERAIAWWNKRCAIAIKEGSGWFRWWAEAVSKNPFPTERAALDSMKKYQEKYEGPGAYAYPFTVARVPTLAEWIAETNTKKETL